MDKPYLTEFIQEKKIDDNSNKIKSMKIFNSFIKENLEKPPSNTILENNIKNSIINSYQELDLENKKLSMEEFSKIFDSFQEEKSESILINFEELQPEFLKVKKMNPLLNEVFENNIINQFGKNSIENLSNHILSLKIFIDNITENQLISPLININELIEGNYNFDESYIKEMKELKMKMKEISYFRKIKNDKNSFYRIIIFQIIESMILYRNINLLKDLISDINQVYSNSDGLVILKELQLEKLINVKLLKQILISIYLNIQDNNIEKAYKIFVVSINSCKTFDLGLIWYYKFSLKKYIEENLNKHYSKSLNFSIGSLLPDKYEDNGTFLYDNYFKENLLKFDCDAEKIVFYLTPYIFSVNINIYSDEGETKNYQFEKEEKINDSDFEINVFHSKGYFELLYSDYYFRKFEKVFNNYINKKDLFSYILEKNLIKEKKEINKNENDNNNNNQDKNSNNN